MSDWIEDLFVPDYEVEQMESGDVWVSYAGFSVHLTKTDEGIVVDVWPGNDTGDAPIASTYAFTNDIEEAE